MNNHVLSTGASATSLPRLLYSRQEAARMLGISVRSLDYAIADKRLNVRRKGSRVLVPYQEVQRYARTDDGGRIQ